MNRLPLIHQFLNQHVSVKVKEGFTVQGVLIHVDISQKHGEIGNLILSDKTIIRGSHVLHVALKR